MIEKTIDTFKWYFKEEIPETWEKAIRHLDKNEYFEFLENLIAVIAYIIGSVVIVPIFFVICYIPLMIFCLIFKGIRKIFNRRKQHV